MLLKVKSWRPTTFSVSTLTKFMCFFKCNGPKLRCHGKGKNHKTLYQYILRTCEKSKVKNQMLSNSNVFYIFSTNRPSQGLFNDHNKIKRLLRAQAFWWFQFFNDSVSVVSQVYSQ